MKAIIQLLCALVGCAAVLAQEPAPAPPSAPGSRSGPTTDSKGRPIPSFLIVGTVFDDKAMSLPGVQVRIRRSDEKKFRWETETNSRGEFAVRVVPGFEYEVVTHVKKYQDQSKMVNAKADVQQRLSIKLEAAKPGKAGVQP